MALENDLSGFRSFQSGQRVQQRCLTRSGDSAKKKSFSRLYIEIDSSQHLDFAGSDAEGTSNVASAKLDCHWEVKWKVGEHLQTARSLPLSPDSGFEHLWPWGWCSNQRPGQPTN